MNDMAKNLILWLIIAAVLVTVMNNFSSPSEANKLNYSEFLQQVQDGRVQQVTVDGFIISGKRQDGSSFETVRPAIQDNGLIKDLIDNNVTIVGKQPEQQSIWTQLLVASFPILVIIAVFMFFMRQTHSARCADGRFAWHRQDPAGQGRSRRSQGAVLHHLRFGLRGNVRGCRCLAGA